MPTLAIILTEDYADWEVALLTATGRAHLGFGIVTASPGGALVTSMGGLRVIPQIGVETLNPDGFDALVICGGGIWQTPQAPDLGQTIRAFVQAGKLVAGICAATTALARAGVLDNVAHTSNEPDLLNGIAAYRGQARYRQVPGAVHDGGIITAAGTAPVTFAREIAGALGFGSAELDGYAALFGTEHTA